MLPRHSPPQLLMRILYSANEHSKFRIIFFNIALESGIGLHNPCQGGTSTSGIPLAGLKVSGCNSVWDPLKKWGNLIFLSATHFL